MDQEKLIRYIKGEHISEAELVEILDWIESSSENRQKYDELKTLWILSGSKNIEALPSQKFFKQEPRLKQFILQQELMKYAAVFILAFFIGALSLYVFNPSFQPTSAFNEIHVPRGEKSMITLYDGSKVWLNSGTTFRYPATFSKKARKVYVEGEAFFDVAKNKKQPFIVSANGLNIKVLGTRFNVDAYQDKDEIKITLEEGSVYAQTESGEKGIQLSPGEQATYNRQSKRATQKHVDPYLYSSWKDNLLRFEDTPIIEVIKKMEHWYGVEITLDKSINPEDKFTMSIKTESLREMLELIAKTIPIKYDINGDKVLITRP